jgi:PcRGLX-like N-terminal RIFT barrel domain/PcRGLX-like protein central beta sandwich domain/PcRGLX-like protein C-terminal alpha/alpha toroid domain
MKKIGIVLLLTLSLLSFAGNAKPRYAAGEDRPTNYYRLYEDRVKLLPLKDKGIRSANIREKSPELKAQRPTPKATFTKNGIDKTNNNVKGFQVKIELLEESNIARQAKIRFGMPWAKSKIYNTEKLSIKNPQDQLVPAQFSIQSRYPDKSIKWLLIQFSAPLKANEKCFYKLNYKQGGNKSKKRLKLTEDKDYFTVDTGKIKAVISKKHFNWLKDIYYDQNQDGKYQPTERRGGFSSDGVVVRDENKKVLKSSSIVPEITIEEQGREVITLLVKGKYGSNPQNALSFTTRLRFYAASPSVAIEHTHINTDLKNEFTDITDLSIKYLPSAKIIEAKTQINNKTISSTEKLVIRQDNDLDLSYNNKTSQGRMSGTLQTKSANNSAFTVSIRDAALRYPKAFRTTADSVNIDLLPEQPGKDYNKHLPHYLEFPFCEGKYRMKWGMSFSENMLFDFSGKIPMAAIDAENDDYVVAVIDQDYLASTKVIPGVLPKADKRFEAWNKNIANALLMQFKQKQIQREYGFLNYGDWFGERGRNWGNNEYDLPRGLFYYFARSGNRKAFRLAVLGASHQSDVDIVHAYPDRYYLGANAEHSIGHTGVSYQRYKRATWSFPYQVAFEAKNGHTWTGGMVSSWTFTGNARVLNSALLLGEHAINFMVPNFTRLGTHERSAGWSLKALMELYKVTYDKAYLEASKKMVDIALKEQKFNKGGAWPHRLPGDHSGGHKNAFGNAPFLLASLLEGLYQYYTYKPSPELKLSIISGGMWLKRSWKKNLLGWPYTLSWDCKPYFKSARCELLVVTTLMYAANLADDKKAYEIAETMMQLATFNGINISGKSFSFDLVLNAEFLQGIYDWNQKHKKQAKYRYSAKKILKLMNKTDNSNFRLRAPEHKKVLIQLKVPEAVLVLERSKHGARPKCKRYGALKLTDKKGKILFEQKFPTSKPCTISMPLKGKKKDIFYLTISDDMTSRWQIKPNKKVKVFAKMSSGSILAGVQMAHYFLNVPKGTKQFNIKLLGVHPGKFGALLLNGKKNTIKRIDGFNLGKCRLPWVKYDRKANYRKNVQINLPEAASKTEIWQIILWASGDIQIKFEGIPSYLSIVPEKLPLNI